MKNKGVYIIFFVLLIIASIIYFTQRKSTIKEELRDFAVKDTASITKIFMVDKKNEKVLLDRKSNYWTVNNKFMARPDAIKTLLETIASVYVKLPVANAALPNIIKQLATNSVKIEIYSGNNKIKVYYVGNATPDQLGTYMILEGSKVPFITHKPGFFGYLSTRYFTNEELWRDNSVFLYDFKDIASVKVHYPISPRRSFTIFNEMNNQFRLVDINNYPVNPIDIEVVKEFVARFRKIKCESYVHNFTQARLDSLEKTQVFTEITVTDRKGNENTIKLYKRPNFSDFFDEEGNLLPNDPDAMYGVLENTKQVVVCQYFVFDPLMMDLSYFLKKTDS